MADVWTMRDRRGRVVALTADGWKHILVERRGAPPAAGEIRKTVEDPAFVTADSTFPRRENYYRRRQREGGGRYLKVVVRYRPVPPDGTWAGEVITAYPTRGMKPMEEQLWP